MRSVLSLLLAGLVFSAGCSTEQDPNKLVAEADALLVNGGIEDAKTRALAEQKYDRAIRIICGGDTDTQCIKSGSGADPGSPAFALSHAHFGLAFARTFDLVERIRQLYASGTISRPTETAKVGDESEEEAAENEAALANQCEDQLNLPQLVPLLKTIVDTSLLPIIADLKAVTNYPEFEITYAKAFLDFSFMDLEATDPLGFELGTDDNDMQAKFTVSEVYGILAVYRVVTLLAQGVFSFNDLTQAAIVYFPKLDMGGDVNPYALSRILNSDPCSSNPLFDASFGVLTEAGSDTFKDVEEQLAALFEEQDLGFNFIESNPDDLRLLNYSGAKKEWATNLAGRIKTGSGADDSTIKAVFAALTSSLPPATLASMFASLTASLQQGTPFDFTAFVKGNDDLNDILTVADVDIASLGLPAVSFKLLFENPVADLKSLAPLSYAESEPIAFNFSEGLPEVLGHEKPVGQEALNLWWTDSNRDAHFNQRGDFIVHTEREVYFDRANDNTPSGHQEDQFFDDGATDPTTKDEITTTRGILGTFWDYDRNGVPDDGFFDMIPGAASALTGAVAISTATNALYFMQGVTDESLTYRDYYDDTLLLYSNGCAEYLPIKQEDEDPWSENLEPVCSVKVGDILGHVWPSLFPEVYAAPGKLDARRRDPANGVVDKIYMFYPNPSLNGALQAPEGKKFRTFANQDFNRLVSSILSLPDVLQKIAKKE